MHNAPSVSYPVGRFVLPLWLWRLHVLLNLAFLSLWAMSQPIGPLWCIAAAGCALVWALGRKTLRDQGGYLCWDGALWRWRLDSPDDGSTLGLEGVGQVNTVLDWQNFLLLRWQPLTYESRPTVRWLWLGRSASPQSWPALRRAVWMQRRSGE